MPDGKSHMNHHNNMKLRIGILQQHNTPNIEHNLKRLAEGVRDLAQRGAQLIVLQGNCTTRSTSAKWRT